MSYQTGISFQNFKSFKDKANFDFSRITVLTGGNSSGKSSVFQALSFFNTFIDETIKKNVNRFDKFEKDRLIATLFNKVDSSKFINQNKIFSNLINRESNSDSLFFEIPLILGSYSNKVTAKFEFEVKQKINHECQLKKFLLYDEFLQEFLVDFFYEKGELKTKINFKLFFNDINSRANKFNSLIKCVSLILESFSIEDIDGNSKTLKNEINNNNEFKKISENIFGSFVEVSSINKYNQIENIKNNPEQFDEAYQFFLKIDENNVYLFTLNNSPSVFISFNNYFFENYRNRIKKKTNVLDGYITSDNLQLLKDEYYQSNSKELLDQVILDKLSEYEFNYDIDDLFHTGNYISYQINSVVHYKILNIEMDFSQHFIKDCLSSLFVDFVNDYIFKKIADSFLNFSINMIDNSSNIKIQRYLDLRESKYNFITEYFNKSNGSPSIDKWLQEFKIGNKITFNTLVDSFVSVLIDEKRNIADEGQGVRNLLLLMFKLHSFIERRNHFYRSKLVYIEEPENGLHPAFQSILAKFLYSICSKYDLQFIIETHSEYLIRQLQVLVANDIAKPTDINIYYFNNAINQITGEKCYEITIDEFGTLSRNFGSGFFDESSNLNVLLYAINRDNYN